MKEKTAEYLSYLFHVITIILYFLLLIFLHDPPSLAILNYFGFIFLGLGIIFLVMSLVNQHQKENEAKVLKNGVYGIVRHPMYLGAVFFFITMVCFLPHWIMVILAPLNILIIYRFMLNEERHNLKKFGVVYRGYMLDVPRVNFILGLIRWIKRTRDGQ